GKQALRDRSRLKTRAVEMESLQDIAPSPQIQRVVIPDVAAENSTRACLHQPVSGGPLLQRMVCNRVELAHIIGVEKEERPVLAAAHYKMGARNQQRTAGTQIVIVIRKRHPV